MHPTADDVTGPKPVGKQGLMGLLGQRGKLPAMVVARGSGRELKNDFNGASAFDSPGNSASGSCVASVVSTK